LVCIVWYGDAEFATFTTPTGFTSGGVLTRKLFVSPGDSKNYAAAIYYKTAAGTETSPEAMNHAEAARVVSV
jgi:hypothetical protein